MGKIYVTKLNQRGEIKVRREIPIPHPIEVLEKRMATYYTQCFPLEVYATVRSFLKKYNIAVRCQCATLYICFHRLNTEQ